MGTTFKGKNLLPEGSNSFPKEQFLMVWKITFTTLGDLPWMLLFITHRRNCLMGATSIHLIPFQMVFKTELSGVCIVRVKINALGIGIYWYTFIIIWWLVSTNRLRYLKFNFWADIVDTFLSICVFGCSKNRLSVKARSWHACAPANIKKI